MDQSDSLSDKGNIRTMTNQKMATKKMTMKTMKKPRLHIKSNQMKIICALFYLILPPPPPNHAND